MIPLPCLSHQTFLTAPSPLPVCSCSSGLFHSLIMTSFLCKNIPFACTILPLIDGQYELAGLCQHGLLI
jgi:hypothetical protein